METILFGTGALIALALLVVIAEPYRFLPQWEEKKKFVGSTYWGIYPGTSSEDGEGQTIELRKACRKERYTAGSSTYAQGRGVNMSGRK